MFFGKNKESEAIELIKQHTQAVDATIKALKVMMDAFISKDPAYDSLAFHVHECEHEADVRRRGAVEKLYSGAFMPTYREDYSRLLDLVDRVANRAETVSDMVAQQRPLIPEELKPDFMQLVDTVIGTFEPMLSIIDAMTNSYETAMELEKKVQSMEQAADRLEWKLIKRVFQMDNLDLAAKLHARELITLVGSIADKIEDAADCVQQILLRRIA